MSVIGKNYGKPTLDLNFAGNKSLIDTTTGRNYVTFSRAQSGNEATYVGSDGLIKYASADEPRFDHDPVTGESLGLLVEESRTNYLGMFASPNYNNSNSATYSAYSDSRFGADQNAHSWTYASAQTNVELGWFNPGSISTTGNGVQYTVSGWIKANQAYTLRGNLIDERRQGINFDFDLTTEWQYFSLSTPAGINDDGSGTVYFRWIRGNIAIPAGLQLDFAAINLERGGFPTSYIPTSGSTVTRAADEASITGSNFTSFWNSEKEGTLFFEHDLNPETQTGNPTNSMIIAFSTSLTTYNGPTLGLWGSGDSRYFPTDYSNGTYNTDGWLTRTDLLANLGITLANPGKDRYAVGYKVGTGLSNLAINGTLLGARDTSADYIPTGLYFGGSHNQRISRLTYYPKRLPDIELQQLTK
jgi:hypothetical protein